MDNNKATELIKALNRIADAIEASNKPVVDKKKIQQEQRMQELEEKLKMLQISKLMTERSHNTDPTI